MAIKKAFSSSIFCMGLPKISSLSNENLHIIGQVDINQIFLLQKEIFYYKLDYYKSVLFQLEVV